MTFLTVAENLKFNVAMNNKDLKEDLEKSYQGAVIPAFEDCVYSDQNNEGLRWV